MKETTTPHYRQGDVLLLKVEEIPADAKKIPGKKVILARGGNTHVINSGAIGYAEDGDVAQFIEVEDQAVLEHLNNAGQLAEHPAITVEAGRYMVSPACEEAEDEEVRRVVD